MIEDEYQQALIMHAQLVFESYPQTKKLAFLQKESRRCIHSFDRPKHTSGTIMSNYCLLNSHY